VTENRVLSKPGSAKETRISWSISPAASALQGRDSLGCFPRHDRPTRKINPVERREWSEPVSPAMLKLTAPIRWRRTDRAAGASESDAKIIARSRQSDASHEKAKLAGLLRRSQGNAHEFFR